MRAFLSEILSDKRQRVQPWDSLMVIIRNFQFWSWCLLICVRQDRRILIAQNPLDKCMTVLCFLQAFHLWLLKTFIIQFQPNQCLNVNQIHIIFRIPYPIHMHNMYFAICFFPLCQIVLHNSCFLVLDLFSSLLR